MSLAANAFVLVVTGSFGIAFAGRYALAETAQAHKQLSGVADGAYTKLPKAAPWLLAGAGIVSGSLPTLVTGLCAAASFKVAAWWRGRVRQDKDNRRSLSNVSSKSSGKGA